MVHLRISTNGLSGGVWMDGCWSSSLANCIGVKASRGKINTSLPSMRTFYGEELFILQHGFFNKTRKVTISRKILQ